jgi:hypothetical protein
MVEVLLWGSLADQAEGARKVEVEAAGLRPELERGVSVSIDGRIYNDSWFQPVAPDSEVVLLKRLKGG